MPTRKNKLPTLPAVDVMKRERRGLMRTLVATELEVLRQRFDKRLAVVRASDAGERLRGLARRPARLGGKVKAGKTF